MLNIKQTIKKTVHQWSQQHCPICGAHFDEYLPAGTDAKVWKDLQGVGAGKRKATCPHCGSSDRERLIFLYLKDFYLPSVKGEKVKCLHIAPETQLSKYLMTLPNIDYIAGDKRCEGYSYPDYVKDIDIMDLSSIDDETFDIVICNHVLEHVPNDTTAMKQIRRVLKDSGIAILQVPLAMKLEKTYENPSATTPEARFKQFGQSDHVRLYGSDYASRLEQAGFKVEIKDIASRYSHKYGLNRDEKIHICHK